MKRRITLHFYLALAVFLAGCGAKYNIRTIAVQFDSKIRVLLESNAKEVTAKFSGAFYILDNVSYNRIAKGKNEILKIEKEKGTLTIDSHQTSSKSIRILTNEFIGYENKKYRGSLVITIDSGGLCVINELDVEEYLCGVVPSELPAGSPMDALKAQAVAARSFAYARKSYKNKDCDVDATTSSQVYGGVTAEKPETNEAVKATKNEVVMYNGSIVTTPFHANCGGSTEDVNHVWQSNISYLKGVACEFCKEGKHYKWECEISAKELSRKLNMNDLDNIEIQTRYSTGRITLLKIKGSSTKYTEAEKFRALVGENTIRNTKFTVKREGDKFKFEGLGWGHGVGLCQEGAVGMAKRGFSYIKILQKYYPNTEIAIISPLKPVS